MNLSARRPEDTSASRARRRNARGSPLQVKERPSSGISYCPLVVHRKVRVKKLLRFPVFTAVSVLAAVFVFSAVAAASNSRETHFGPFASTSPDGGTCGNPWANDTFNREFKVMDNGDGTFRVREEFKEGSFVTIGGPSPGACETSGDHGTVVLPGITGKMHGYLQGTVTSGTFDANGCTATLAACTTTQGFLAAVFGVAGPATFTCNVGPSCGFKFEYSAGDQGLLFHHWEDASNSSGAEIFKGDIANT